MSDLLSLGARLGAATDVDYVPAHVAYASETERDAWQDQSPGAARPRDTKRLTARAQPYLPRPFAVGQGSPADRTATFWRLLPGIRARQVVLDSPHRQPFSSTPSAIRACCRRSSPPGTGKERSWLLRAPRTGACVLRCRRCWSLLRTWKETLLSLIWVSGDTDLISVYATDTRPAHQTIDNGPQDGTSGKRHDSPAEHNSLGSALVEVRRGT